MPHALFRRPEEILVAMVFCLFLGVLVSIWYKYYLRMPILRTPILAAAVVAGGIAWLWASSGRLLENSPFLIRSMNRDQFTYFEWSPSPVLVSICMLAFLVTFALACGFLIKLYRTWILDAATPAERQTGVAGVRAWLNPLNIITVLLIVVGTYCLLGWNLWQTILALLVLLLAYPLFNTLIKGSAPVADSANEAAEERRRVLALVEAGKISADDGAELIAALGQSRAGDSARLEASGAITPNRRIMLLGAALVLVGFFLPWFKVNLGEQMRALANGLQQQFQNALPMIPPELFPGTGSPTPAYTAGPTPTALVLSVAGGDIAHGLGWIILVLSLCVAVLPLIWPTRPANRHLQRTLSLLGLAAASAMALYLLSGITNAATHLGIGFVLLLAGNFVLWIGVAREYIRGRQTPRPSLAPAGA